MKHSITLMAVIWSIGTAIVIPNQLGHSYVTSDNFDSSMDSTESIIYKKKQISAPVDVVWKMWTTEDGVNSFFGSDAKIEMKIGGPYEIHFVMDRPPGQRGTEGARLLAFIPNRMLAFEWGIPRQFSETRQQFNKLWNRTWVVIILEQIDRNLTELEVYHRGLGSGKEWDQINEFYDHNWDAILDRLAVAITSHQ